MTMVLTASNLSCPRCRDLTSNLIKSVDAFEILATGDEGTLAQILISTIRKIITKALTADVTETETTQQLDNQNNRTNCKPQNQGNDPGSRIIDVNSALVPASNTVDDFSMPDNWGMDNGFENFGNESENLLDPQFESNSNSPVVQKTRKRRRQGRSNWCRKRRPRREDQTAPSQGNRKTPANEQSNPRRSGRQTNHVASSSLALVPAQKEVSSGSTTTSLVPRYRERSKVDCRPIATEEDFERANEYLKKLTVDTADGLFYYLYECTQCSQQFANHAANVRRHIVNLHFNKRILAISNSSMAQLGPNKIRFNGRPIKVKLYSKDSRTANNYARMIKTVKLKIPAVTDRSKRSREKIQSFKKKKKATKPRRLSSSLFTPASPIKRSISFPVAIPPNLTVTNPFANFDLEKTLNARVCVKLTPNLTSIRKIPCDPDPDQNLDQGQGRDQSSGQNSTDTTTINGDSETIQGPLPQKAEIVEADSNTNEKIKIESPRFDPFQVLGLSTDTSITSPAKSCGENTGENLTADGKEADGPGQMLSDVISDLIEMDVDTILKIPF